jgi:hypothetical protein
MFWNTFRVAARLSLLFMLSSSAALARYTNLRAYLKVDVVNEGDAGNLHRMTTAFDDNTSWNDLGGGVTPGRNAVATSDATTNFMRPRTPCSR